ncbi:hypothetical protein HPB48_005931 [Haemaphysalis longicornis]|uniref:Uncharacterized protein n=1 Tax=Haemaphysalis longicornis TaxID=44386 RepID=A0A9J6FM85_HAELO|nr:hypothetical protein HPB48_005931 [Haemaphysalis longicornis]
MSFLRGSVSGHSRCQPEWLLRFGVAAYFMGDPARGLRLRLRGALQHSGLGSRALAVVEFTSSLSSKASAQTSHFQSLGALFKITQPILLRPCRVFAAVALLCCFRPDDVRCWAASTARAASSRGGADGGGTSVGDGGSCQNEEVSDCVSKLDLLSQNKSLAFATSEPELRRICELVRQIS